MPKASGAAALPLLLSLLPAAGAAAEKPFPPAGFDAYAERALREFDVPGAGVAVVKDGRVALLRGYGVRRKGAAAPVTADTLFAIASNTKVFTAAGLGLLAEEGKLSWDDPVERHLAEFRMFDPYASKEITLRDLLTHRSGLGLGQGDLLYFPPSDLTRAEIVRRARFLRPESSFRSRYAYSNLMFVVAGEAIAAVSGQSWDDFVKARILLPLGMARSNTSPRAFAPGDDVATPHASQGGVATPVEWEVLDNLAAAGGINSSAADMARFLGALLQAGRGNEAGAGPLKPRLVRELWSAQTVVPIPEPTAGLEALHPRFLAYGLGVGLRDYRGHKVVTHTGGLRGMVSRVLLVPEEGLGIVVLTNQESGEARDALAYRLLDAGLGAPASDWITAFREAKQRQDAKTRAVEEKQERARATDSKPSLPLAGYAGRYEDAWYGEATLADEDGKLVLRFSRSPALTGDLVHWQYDTFVARWRDPTVPDAFLSFSLRPDGSVEQLKMKAVSPAADFSYDYHDLLFTPVEAGPR